MTTLIGQQRRPSALLASATLVATLVLIAGCGASGDETNQPSSTEAWAGRVCSSAANWLGAVTDAQATLTDTSNISAETLRGALDDLTGATETLVTNLGKIGVPNTTSGDQAQAQLSSLSDELQQQNGVITDATDQAAGSVQGVLAQVSTVAQAVATMLTDISTAVDNLRQLKGADELENAFRHAQSCQQLRASASPSA
jgi:hypothetical protein